MTEFDTIIVGMGAIGSSAAYALAKRGVRVLGLEQRDIPHARGSSHGSSRAIRMCYYEHPDYVPLLKRAYELWNEMEWESGQKLLHVTGGLYMGRPDNELVEGSARSGAMHNLPHEVLTRSTLATRYPQFAVDDDYVAVYEPMAGLLIPERVVATQVELALRAGAELHGHERVIGWESDGETARVRTVSREYRAKRLILCAGAWAQRAIGEANIPGVTITATRQTLGWVWPKQPEEFRLGVLPVWGIADDELGMSYGFPMMPPGEGYAPGFKLARHVRGAVVDPDNPGFDATLEDEAELRSTLRRFFPSADGSLLAMRVCMYENSPDSHFIVDRLPLKPNVIVACGFSGHGFKFASVMGESLADLATVGEARLSIGFLGLGRFAQS